MVGSMCKLHLLLDDAMLTTKRLYDLLRVRLAVFSTAIRYQPDTFLPPAMSALCVFGRSLCPHLMTRRYKYDGVPQAFACLEWLCLFLNQLPKF